MLALGAALGVGAVLLWIGARRLADNERRDTDRRRGFWTMNAGLLLMAVSMIAFMRLGAD